MKALASTASYLLATVLIIALKAHRLIPENFPYAPFQSAPPGFLPILSKSLRQSLSCLTTSR